MKKGIEASRSLEKFNVRTKIEMKNCVYANLIKIINVKQLCLFISLVQKDFALSLYRFKINFQK